MKVVPRGHKEAQLAENVWGSTAEKVGREDNGRCRMMCARVAWRYVSWTHLTVGIHLRTRECVGMKLPVLVVHCNVNEKAGQCVSNVNRNDKLNANLQ